MYRLLLVVDAQGDFVYTNGALPIPGAEERLFLINNHLRTLDPSIYTGVVFTYDTHKRRGWKKTPEGQQFKIHCVEGTPGWHLAVQPASIHRTIPQWRLRKGVFDMWAEPGLKLERLTERSSRVLTGDIDRDYFFRPGYHPTEFEVDVIGFATDVCVRDAVKGLIARGFKVRVHRSMVAGIVKSLDQVYREDWGASPSVRIVEAFLADA